MNRKELLQVIDFIYIIAKDWGTKVVYTFEDVKYLGATGARTHHIYLNMKYCCSDERILLPTFFHELAHIYCIRNGIYPAYHSYNKNRSKKEVLAIKRTALRAELYVEKLGESMMRDYFPTVRYAKSYITDRQKESLRKDIQARCSNSRY